MTETMKSKIISYVTMQIENYISDMRSNLRVRDDIHHDDVNEVIEQANNLKRYITFRDNILTVNPRYDHEIMLEAIDWIMDCEKE
jgi:hypothetical protein